MYDFCSQLEGTGS